MLALPQPPRDTEIVPEDIPLDIIYEDQELTIVNKPAGMVVHPAFGNWTGTLVNALVYHFQHLPTGRNGDTRPGLVHRIDKDTSGPVSYTHLDVYKRQKEHLTRVHVFQGYPVPFFKILHKG